MTHPLGGKVAVITGGSSGIAARIGATHRHRSFLGALEAGLAAREGLGGLLLRLILGSVFLAHGYLAAFVYTPAGTAQYMESIGLPLPGVSAWFLIAVHLTGGVMILLGFLTRLNAIVHALVMAVATAAAHLDQGFYLQGVILDPASGATAVAGFEYALTITLAAFALVFVGPGSYSIDGTTADRG